MRQLKKPDVISYSAAPRVVLEGMSQPDLKPNAISYSDACSNLKPDVVSYNATIRPDVVTFSAFWP